MDNRRSLLLEKPGRCGRSSSVGGTQSTLVEEAVGVYPSAELENIAEARLPKRFENMSPKVGRRQSPGRVTPGTNFGWGVFYTQQSI